MKKPLLISLTGTIGILITIFGPMSEGLLHAQASINFNTGIVYDIDCGYVKDQFNPGTGKIGFFLHSPFLTLPLFVAGSNAVSTVPFLDPHGYDLSGTFPLMSHIHNKHSLAGPFDMAPGFTSLPGGAPYFAIEQTSGITPVPGPGTMFLLGSGLNRACRTRESFSEKIINPII